MSSLLPKLKKLLPVLVMINLVISSHICVAQPQIKWQNLRPGIAYTRITLNSNHGSVEAFKIDPSKYQLQIVPASTINKLTANVTDLAFKSKALLAINGGFFDINFQPLGLRVSEQITLNEFRPISWWGTFYINKANKAKIARGSLSAQQQKNTVFAIQSGPILLKSSKILVTEKDSFANRSALGITPDKQVIIAITKNTKLSLHDFAQSLLYLGCENALNLDGGSSSQLYSNFEHFHLSITSFGRIVDAIVVKPQIRDLSSPPE